MDAAPTTPVQRGGGDGQRPRAVRSMEDFENMELVKMFDESCPGWAVPKEFMVVALEKLSQHHPGHLRVRTLPDILRIVNVAVYNGIHDLAAFSGWAPECLVSLLNDANEDWSVISCAKDLSSFAVKLREWCHWAGPFAGDQEEDDVSRRQDGSRVLALHDLDSPEKNDKPVGKGRRPHRLQERDQDLQALGVSRSKRTPSPKRRSVPRSGKSPKDLEKSRGKRKESSSPRRSRSRRLLRIESTLKRVSHKKFGEDFVPGDEDLELSDYLGKRADMSRAVDELMSERKLENFEVDFLPDPKTIVDLHRVFSRSKSPYISQKPLEEVIPVYLLQGLPSSQKASFLKNRQSEVPTMARLLENVLAFWLAHHVAGMVDLKAIVQHLFLLLKMAQSKSVVHAVWYSRLLPDHVRSRVVRKDKTVESFLEVVIEDVDKKAGEMAKKSLGHGKPPSNVEKSRTRQPTRKTVQETGTKSQAKPDPVPVEKQVCLAHDTANNKTCPKGSDCPRVHLDTKKSQKDAKAYKEAQDLVLRLKRKAKNGHPG